MFLFIVIFSISFFKLTGDILKNEIENINVICGGFPCQDISNAGKGVGLSGVRSGL